MININHVTLVGRLVRDIELRKTNSNTSVCSFTVAVDRRFKSQQGGQDADFVSCIAWRQSAEFLAKYGSKGAIVSVEGRIQTRNYDNASGQKVYVTEVVAESVQLISNRNSQGMNGSTMNTQTFTPSVEPSFGSDPMEDDFSNTPSLDISSDDLPFY